MIVILEPNIDLAGETCRNTLAALERLPGVTLRRHEVQGAEQRLHEIYLIGDTHKLDQQEIESLGGVDHVVRISDEYRILGRHRDKRRSYSFSYQGITFNQDNLNLFAGLCAVDTPQHVDATLKALSAAGLQCTRMGAYKPRTNPYSFQGHGAGCLDYVFELAGKHGMRIIAMEVTHEKHIDEIDQMLEKTGRPVGVMLQIGTRNTQNFELLKAVGRQREFPVLFKRGFGVSLNESLNAAEYLASEGSSRVIFCLRGMQTAFAAPHRNMVDFAHVPVIKRLTRMPVCVDPSHSVGTRDQDPGGVMDLVHAAAQGVLAGANMILVDFHPDPPKALVDGPQAMLLSELPKFVQDMQSCHALYQTRQKLWNQ